MLSERAAYEAEVRAIAEWGAERLAAGLAIEAVARGAVARRNDLKRRYRVGADPAIVALLELRNLRKYGDSVGPDADALRGRYESWEAVLAAACRPAALAGS